MAWPWAQEGELFWDVTSWVAIKMGLSMGRSWIIGQWLLCILKLHEISILGLFATFRHNHMKYCLVLWYLMQPGKLEITPIPSAYVIIFAALSSGDDLVVLSPQLPLVRLILCFDFSLGQHCSPKNLEICIPFELSLELPNPKQTWKWTFLLSLSLYLLGCIGLWRLSASPTQVVTFAYDEDVFKKASWSWRMYLQTWKELHIVTSFRKSNLFKRYLVGQGIWCKCVAKHPFRWDK